MQSGVIYVALPNFDLPQTEVSREATRQFYELSAAFYPENHLASR